MFTETLSTSEQEPDSVVLAGFRSLSARLCVKLSSAVACLSQKCFHRGLHTRRRRVRNALGSKAAGAEREEEKAQAPLPEGKPTSPQPPATSHACQPSPLSPLSLHRPCASRLEKVWGINRRLVESSAGTSWGDTPIWRVGQKQRKPINALT